MPNGSYADYIRHWGQLDDRAKANPELAPFEPVRAELEIERAGLVELTNLQGALKYQLQENSRAIDARVKRGRELATRLRDAIKAIYGRDAEKLTEFGVPVRRPRTTSAEAKKKKAEEGPNPSPAAASETRGTT